MTAGGPLFSVVVPFKNAARFLPGCLDALSRQTYGRAEFILVDNNSTDNSWGIVKDFMGARGEGRMSLKREKTPGPGAARNTGAGAASGEWLVFTDADCLPDPEWLADLAEIVQKQPDLGAIAGSILPAPSANLVSRFLGMYTLLPNRTAQLFSSYTLVQGGFPSANLAVRREVFKKTGGFPQDRFWGEDHELCRRIYQTGHSIQTATNAKVQHIHRETVSALCRQSYGFGSAHPLLLSQTVEPTMIIQAPFINICKSPAPFRLWIDLQQADKKFLMLCIPGLVWMWLWFLPLLFFVYLSLKTYFRPRQIGLRLYQAPVIVFLLLLKSASLGLGRLRGSIRVRTACL
jgi:glycosyltransferase involved in cell wall biosynthesis